MADTPAPTPSGWIPTFESIKGISWVAIAKWAVAIAAILAAYAAYANLAVVSDYLKPEPPPTVVEYVPAAQFQALQAEVSSLKAGATPTGQGVSVAEFEALAARVKDLEGKFGKRRRK